MSWNLPSKIASSELEKEILTPDLFQILVGENEDQILIYEEGFDHWNLKAKTESAWGLKSKDSATWSLKNKVEV